MRAAALAFLFALLCGLLFSAVRPVFAQGVLPDGPGYREKAGPCKKLDDLKKVVGPDYQEIDARKDRLVCM